METSRMVGWLITETKDADCRDRIGYGQCIRDAEATEGSYNNVIGRTIFMSEGLSHIDIPADKRVKWRSYSDDGDPAYEGYVHWDWLLGDVEGTEDGEDLAYNIDRFNMEDWGAVHVLYRGNDMIKHAPDDRRQSIQNMVDRNAITNPATLDLFKLGPNVSNWLPIYG